jgi:exosortase D (VPLPA-CTERM-specific)
MTTAADNSKTAFYISSALGIILFLAAVILYWNILVDLFNRMVTDEDFSFGLLLPLVSAYVIYLKWPELRQRTWEPSWLGLPVIMAAFIMRVFGEMFGGMFLPAVSFVVLLSAIVILIGGIPLLRFLVFPLLLLFMAIPTEALIIKMITMPLQLISSVLATWALQMVGIPAFRQGNVIDLGVRQLQVVAACSGLRYILSLFALAVIFCYFYQRRPWKAILLTLLIVPAAILANALRVAAMGLYPALQEGFLHMFSGWLIFIFCFAFISLCNAGLNRFWPDPSNANPRDPDAAAAAQAKSAPRVKSVKPGKYLLVGLLVTCSMGLFSLQFRQAPPLPLRQSFDSFPIAIGNWQGYREFLEKNILAALHSDIYVSANYTNPEFGHVNFWMVYYPSYIRHGTFAHAPIFCLTGAGWNIQQTGLMQLGPGLPVKTVIVERDGVKMLVFYWFLYSGRWINHEQLGRIYVGYSGMFRRRTDSAMVRLMTTIENNNVAAAEDKLTTFGRLILPLLPKYIDVDIPLALQDKSLK